MKSSDPFIETLHDCIELIMRSSMRSFFHYAKETGLSMPQIGALFQLNRGATSGISNISDDLGVSSAAASQMLDRLVQQELILRTEDPDDRRVKNIVLTEKGRKVIVECIQVRQAWMENLAAALSPEERNQIMSAFKILIHKANQIDQPAA
jgi:DNA-binding MarR family transcriptional regulator